MKIEILGTGCAKCNELEMKVKQAVAQSGKFVPIEKISDIQKLMSYGVLTPPGLVLDGAVKSTGRILSVDAILQLIR